MLSKCENCEYLMEENHHCPTEIEKLVVQRLIACAAIAQELFEPDELEETYAWWRRNRRLIKEL